MCVTNLDVIAAEDACCSGKDSIDFQWVSMQASGVASDRVEK